jgi:hypothetical protein
MKVGKARAAVRLPPSKTGSIVPAFHRPLTFAVKLTRILAGLQGAPLDSGEGTVRHSSWCQEGTVIDGSAIFRHKVLRILRQQVKNLPAEGTQFPALLNG